MFKKLTADLLDLVVQEKGYRLALYAAKQGDGGCAGSCSWPSTRTEASATSIVKPGPTVATSSGLSLRAAPVSVSAATTVIRATVLMG